MKNQSVKIGKHKIKLTKKNIKIILCVLVIGLVALFITDRLGVYTFDDLFVDLGIKDPEFVYSEGNAKVHYIDVGQGDSILIVSDDKTFLIDAGEYDAADKVISYIKALGITKLDYVLGTHPHSDHIGGLSYVIDEFDVGQVILPKLPDDQTPTTVTYERLLTSIKNKNLKITQAKDMTFDFGSGKIVMYAPINSYDNLNNYSVVVKFIHGENSFLFTGDLETNAEKDLIGRGVDLSADVLKAGHHGSSTSSSKKFLDEVDPEYFVIMVGEGNQYNHPHQEVINRFKTYSNKIYRTDLNGDIVFLSDKNTIKVEKSK